MVSVGPRSERGGTIACTSCRPIPERSDLPVSGAQISKESCGSPDSPVTVGRERQRACATAPLRPQASKVRMFSWTGEYVFDRGDGRPVDPDAFGKAFRDARDAAGLAGVRLHDVRHAVASLLVAAGTNPRVVSDVLGHATVGFTMQTYVHPDEDAAVAVIAETERLLGPALT